MRSLFSEWVREEIMAEERHPPVILSPRKTTNHRVGESQGQQRRRQNRVTLTGCSVADNAC